MSALTVETRDQDGVCPACGAALAQCAGRRKKKVQCPKCREIVVLGVLETLPTPSQTVDAHFNRELVEIKSRLAQLGPMRNRLAEVERELASLKAEFAPVTISATADAPPSKSIDPSPSLPSFESEVELPGLASTRAAYGLHGGTSALLCENFMPYRGARVSLVSAEGDGASRIVAEYLRDQFLSAGWRVLGLRTERLPAITEGFTLSSGTGPISAPARAIRRAFAAANLALAYQLDPSISDPSVTLVVGYADPGGEPRGILPPAACPPAGAL